MMEVEDDDRQRRWSAHCHRMAEDTYALADWCEDLDMMEAYVELAAKWVIMAEGPPR
ncbi:MAG: hypothetical protein JWQ97_4045 [Phenylobacterium sp.]|nr:hypothetical protein [Phenylobacterium sp.]